MKSVIVAVAPLFANAIIDLSWSDCGGGAGNFQRLVPASIANKGTTEMKAYTTFATEVTGGKFKFNGYYGDITTATQTFDICEGTNIDVGNIRVQVIMPGCPLAVGLHEIKIVVSGDATVKIGSSAIFGFYIDLQPEDDPQNCLYVRSFENDPSMTPGIFNEDQYTSLRISYPAPTSLQFGTSSSCEADHYRLTMNDAGLLLVATDKDEKPLSSMAPEPRDFRCQNKGMFDQLYDKRDCLKIDQNSHLMTSNGNDQESDHPCAEDNDNCAWGSQSKTWTFRQSWTDFNQVWCMQDVDVSGCELIYEAADLQPTVDLTKCSTKWDVQKTFVKSAARRRRRRSALQNPGPPTCSDCDGNFQCLTSVGCTSAASQEICESLQGLTQEHPKGWWCPSEPWQPCTGKVCCNPHTEITQYCPGGVACRECGGGDSCQCPGQDETVV